MIKYLLILLFLPVVVLSFGQIQLDVYDGQRLERLNQVEVDGAKILRTSPDGTLILDSLSLVESKEIRLFRKGYSAIKIRVEDLQRSNPIFMDPLTLIFDPVLISINHSDRSRWESIESLAARNARDLLAGSPASLNLQLNKIPGILMQSGTRSTNRLTIRGIGSRTPYSSNRIRAYFDDLALTDGNGVTSIEDIDPMMIGSVEVLKGPASNLYGSATGGILKINSWQIPAESNQLDLMGHLGSFNERYLAIRAASNKESHSVAAFFSHLQEKGARQNSEYTRNNLLVKASKWLNNTKIKGLLLYQFVDGQIPSSIKLEDFEKDPSLAAQNWAEAKGFERYHKGGINLGAKSYWGDKINNEINLNLHFRDPYESRPFNMLDELGWGSQLSNRFKFAYNQFQFSWTLQYQWEKLSWQILANDNGQAGDLIDDYLDIKSHANTGFQFNWNLRDKALLEASINLNLSSYRLEDLANPTIAVSRQLFEPLLSPALGFNYQLFEQNHLYASLRHGFSPPSLEESLLPEGEVNENLMPETAWMIEGGYRTLLADMLSAEIILYAIRTENMLLTERISEEIFFGINAGKVEQKGLEVSLHLDPFKQKENRSFRPSLRSSFSTSENLFVDFVDKGIDYAGNSLPGIPRFSWQNECLLLFGERASIQVEHSLYGSQFLRDDNLLSYDGHQLFNLHSDIKMISHKHYDLHLKASVYNVFNEAHASMILVNAPSFGNNAPRYYYPGRPRSWQIGFLMKRKK